MTMSDPSDSSTAISNNSFDETFASNKFSSNSFRNSSLLQSDELEDNSYGDVDRREQVEAETERVEDKQQPQQQQPELKKKRTGVTLVYAPEKSATLFNTSTQNSTVPIQSNDKVMIIHSKQDNGNHNDDADDNDDDIDSSNNNYTENHSFTNKHDIESTMNSSMQFNRTLSSSASNEENLSQSNHQHSHIVIEELTNSNNISHSNSSDQFSSDNYDNHSSELSNYEDPSEGIGDDDHNTNTTTNTSINNNVNLNHNKDNHYNNTDNVLSTSPAVLTSSPSSLDNHKDLSILSMMESESSSKDILTTTTTTTTSSISNNNDVNNNKNESYTNNTINFDENNNSTTMLQNQQELNTNTSSIIHPINQHINNTSPVNLTTLSLSDNFIKSTISTDHDVNDKDGDDDDDDDALFQSNLNNNRTQGNYESDDEVTKTFLNIHDQYKQTMNTFNEQPVPLYLDRCSPAQIVAVTGGAPFDIIRDIEEDFYDGNDDADVRDGDNVVEVLNTNVKRDGDSSASPVNSDHIVRKRGHTTSESSKPVSINIDLRVVSKLTPSTPEEVDASSELVFSNFMINRYMLEVSASAHVSSSQQSTASTSASIHLSGINPEIESDDPVSHQLSALPRAEPHSIEAIVARNLAEIGDEINRIYGSRLDRMIKLLPVEDCPLEMFYNVARVLFARGPTNWGQVITLFYFGYRLVVQRVKKGIANAFYQVCRCLIGFCRQINIFVWIAQQGGWQILQFLRSNNKTTTCDYENVDEKANHHDTITSNSTLYTNENDQQNTLLLNNNNNQSMDNLNNDSRLLIPLVLTSTGFVVIAVALWFYLRR
ncbi:unnamed protein product [Schistosoma turkestanicum]|nr:unnamed protein product [Schistosoma turkestanicum]